MDFNKIASNLIAKQKFDQNIIRAISLMLEELENAEKSIDKARQFGRVLQNEQSIEWIVNQIESFDDSFKSILKEIQESLNYLLPS